MGKFRSDKFSITTYTIGSIIAVISTLIWMVGTYLLGVPAYFLLFGLLIISVALINFSIKWKKYRVEQIIQKNELEVASTYLEEPTFVYCYCEKCGKAVTSKHSSYCKECE